MTETLRERQNTLTRDVILEALAELVTGDGVHDFSIREVAERAGVSHRTVYRHYDSREQLLAALVDRVDERMRPRGGVGRVETPAELAPAIRTNYELFGELAPDVAASIILAVGAGIQPPQRHRRTEALRTALAGLVDHLGDDAEAVVALLRTLGSSRLWFLLTRELDVGSSSAGRAVSWAARVLVDALRAGDGPGVADDTHDTDGTDDTDDTDDDGQGGQ